MTSTDGKGSPFLSLFHRKKRVNGTKSNDDIKSAHLKEEKPIFTTPTKEIKEKKEKTKSRDSHTLPNQSSHKKKKSKEKKSFWGNKSYSLDDLIEEDPKVLVEALETIANEQPMVARSIPKHATLKKREDKSMKNCLFEKDVYDTMLSDSLRVCDMLQSHLDDCMVSVRAKSPEHCLESSQDCHDSGRGASSASSTISSSPGIQKKALKSCVRADV